MAIGPFSDYLIEQMLRLAQNGWLGLAYDNPEIAGAYASEVFGGSYTRIEYALTAPSSKGMLLLNDVKFDGLPAVSVAYVTGWDAQYNGNYLWSAPLPSPRGVLAGKSLSIPAGSIGLSMT